MFDVIDLGIYTIHHFKFSWTDEMSSVQCYIGNTRQKYIDVNWDSVNIFISTKDMNYFKYKVSRHREEEPLNSNSHNTSIRQLKQSNKLSIPRQSNA